MHMNFPTHEPLFTASKNRLRRLMGLLKCNSFVMCNVYVFGNAKKITIKYGRRGVGVCLVAIGLHLSNRIHMETGSVGKLCLESRISYNASTCSYTISLNNASIIVLYLAYNFNNFL